MQDFKFKKTVLAGVAACLFATLSSGALAQAVASAKSTAGGYRIAIPVHGLVVKDSWPTGPFGPYDPADPTHPNHPANPANAQLEPTLAPASMSFGARQAGETDVSQVVHLANTHTTKTLTVARVALEGTGADQYSFERDCSGVKLVPGEVCDIKVLFTPQVGFAGQALAQIVVEHNGDNGALAATSSGQSAAPSASLKADAFGAVNVGSSRTVDATLTNTGIGPLKLVSTTPAVTGDGFTFVETDCKAVLPVKGTCNATLQFVASSTQVHTGKLVWASNAGDLTVSLSGSGLQSDLRMTPTAVPGFGKLGDGKTATSGVITLKNTGNAPATGLSINAGDPARGFSITDSTCAASLAASSQCTFKVHFAPTQSGAYRSELQVMLGQDVKASSSLTGASASAALVFSPTVQYVATLAGSTQNWHYLVTNSGDKPVKLDTVKIELSDPSVMRSTRIFPEDSCTDDTIPAYSSCKIWFNSGAEDGHYSQDFQRTLIEADGNSYDLQMRMWADAVKPVFTPQPASIDFGSISEGDTALSQLLTLKLSATNSARVWLKWAMPTGYELVESTCSDTVPSTTTCVLKVRFAPTAPGTYNGDLTVTTARVGQAAATNYSTSIALRGTAVAMQAPGLQGGKFPGVVAVGQSDSANFTFFNPSSQALAISALSSTNSAFAVTAGSCSGSIPAGGKCSGAVRFTPVDGSTVSAELQLTANGVKYTLPLTATGGVPQMVATPATYVWPVPVYLYSVGGYQNMPIKAFSFKNIGTAALASATMASDNAGVKVSSNNFGCAGGVPSGQSCAASIYLNTYAVGNIKGNLIIEGPGSKTLVPYEVTVVDTAVVPRVSKDFTAVSVGKATTALYKVTNDEGIGLIQMGAASLSGNTQEYTLGKGTNCGSVLYMPKGGSCDVEIIHTPNAVGQRPPATLTIAMGGHVRKLEVSAPPAQ